MSSGFKTDEIDSDFYPKDIDQRRQIKTCKTNPSGQNSPGEIREETSFLTTAKLHHTLLYGCSTLLQDKSIIDGSNDS